MVKATAFVQFIPQKPMFTGFVQHSIAQKIASVIRFSFNILQRKPWIFSFCSTSKTADNNFCIIYYTQIQQNCKHLRMNIIIAVYEGNIISPRNIQRPITRRRLTLIILMNHLNALVPRSVIIT